MIYIDEVLAEYSEESKQERMLKFMNWWRNKVGGKVLTNKEWDNIYIKI
jgi:hypothetical protein